MVQLFLLDLILFHSGPRQKSMKEPTFSYLLTIFAKKLILDIWQGPGCTCEYMYSNVVHTTFGVNPLNAKIAII